MYSVRRVLRLRSDVRCIHAKRFLHAKSIPTLEIGRRGEMSARMRENRLKLSKSMNQSLHSDAVLHYPLATLGGSRKNVQSVS
jgi:hypothetical protein